MSFGQAQDSSGRSCVDRVGILTSYIDDIDYDQVCTVYMLL